MRRATIVSPPIGRFAGNPTLPQGMTEPVHRDLIDGMTGDPGLRLSGIGRRRYKGGALTPQAFLRSDGGPNSREALAVAATIRNDKRSAISRSARPR